ncbi:MAG: hypothetical protein Q9183_001857 [Haloplaca sp. 2 TL-2023]
MVRHGPKQRAWVALGILAVIRVVGDAMELVSLRRRNNGYFIAAAILNGIGLNALLSAMAGLLGRANNVLLTMQANQDSEKGKNGHSGLRAKFVRKFKMIHVPLVVAVILTSIGSSYIYDSDSTNNPTGRSLAQAGIIVFMVVLLGLVLLTSFTFGRFLQLPTGEKRILIAVAVSIPFLATRLTWSLLVYFDRKSTLFELKGGNIFVRSFMAVMEEWIVVILYLAAGLAAPVVTTYIKKPHVEQSSVG